MKNVCTSLKSYVNSMIRLLDMTCRICISLKSQLSLCHIFLRMYNLVWLLLIVPQLLLGIEFDLLKQSISSLQSKQCFFNYPLKISLLEGKSSQEDVILMLHGYGSNHKIAKILQSYGDISNHLISFNFPDYDIIERRYDVKLSCFGTIQELLPALYLLKILAIDANLRKINLYGFSAGGGALINVLAVLNNSKYDKELQGIGIKEQDKKTILKALENGWILLDAPLKSMEEIMASRNFDNDHIMAQRYRENNMRPIDALAQLNGLSLQMIVYFEQPDQAVTNRDDALYFKRLQQFNATGKNYLIKGSTGGHSSYHKPLWDTFNQLAK